MRMLLTCCCGNRGHAPHLNRIVGVQLGLSRRAGPAPRAQPGPPNALSPDPTLGQNLGLVLGGTLTAVIAVHALGPTPAGGSPALVPTVQSTAARGARALPLCRTGAVTLAAGAMTSQKKHTVMAEMLMLGRTLTPAHVWGCLA